MKDYKRKNISLDELRQNLNDAMPGSPPEVNLKRTAERRNVSPGDDTGTAPPLTAEEAEAVQQRIAEIKQRGRALVDRLDNLLEKVDQQAMKDPFSLDISRRPKLKRVAKKIFGYQTSEITYDMYKEAVAEKDLLEREQAKEYN